MTRRLWLLAAVLFCLIVPAAAQVKGPIVFTVQVDPGRWKALRIRNLPKDAVVGVGVQTDGEVGVAFVDARQYRDYPAVQAPLFQGRIERRFSFSVTIPEPGHYYVVFDNRTGRQPRTVTVRVQAARQKPPPPAKDARRPSSHLGLGDVATLFTFC
jgi:hypothetical protein